MPEDRPPRPESYSAIYGPVAVEAARLFGIPEILLLNLIGHESSFNPKARGQSGEVGIAQFIPETSAKLAEQWGWQFDPTDPYQSIFAAARHLSELRDYYKGDLAKAVAAYNAGQPAVDKASKAGDQIGDSAWRRFIPSSTREYLSTVGSNIDPKKLQSPSRPSRAIPDFESFASQFSGARRSLTRSSPSRPTIDRPPRPEDFTIEDENGDLTTDWFNFGPALDSYWKSKLAEREFNLGPASQAVDDMIKEIDLEIQAGNLSVSKASLQLKSRLDAYKNAMDVFTSRTFEFGIPEGAEYIPGREPDSYATRTLGLAPKRATPVPLNPLQEALETYREAQNLAANIPVPTIPDISGQRQNIYREPTPSSPPLISSPSHGLNPAETAALEEALWRERAYWTR